LGGGLLVPAGAFTEWMWALVAAFSGCIWFLSYALTEKPAAEDPFWQNGATLFSLWPAVGVLSSVPFMKRASFMRRMEAKNAEEFAVTQLKGLKLLAWSVALALMLAFFMLVISGLGIPEL